MKTYMCNTKTFFLGGGGGGVDPNGRSHDLVVAL